MPNNLSVTDYNGCLCRRSGVGSTNDWDLNLDYPDGTICFFVGGRCRRSYRHDRRLGAEATDEWCMSLSATTAQPRSSTLTEDLPTRARSRSRSGAHRLQLGRQASNPSGIRLLRRRLAHVALYTGAARRRHGRRPRRRQLRRRHKSRARRRRRPHRRHRRPGHSRTRQHDRPSTPSWQHTDTCAGGDPSTDTQIWMPLTTVTGGVPEFVWDGDDELIPTLVAI